MIYNNYIYSTMPTDHDKFYTKHNIVEECCNYITQHIDIDKETDLIIEPSAGNGEWIKPIKELTNNIRFYDIKPEMIILNNKII